MPMAPVMILALRTLTCISCVPKYTRQDSDRIIGTNVCPKGWMNMVHYAGCVEDIGRMAGEVDGPTDNNLVCD